MPIFIFVILYSFSLGDHAKWYKLQAHKTQTHLKHS